MVPKSRSEFEDMVLNRPAPDILNLQCGVTVLSVIIKMEEEEEEEKAVTDCMCDELTYNKPQINRETI